MFDFSSRLKFAPSALFVLIAAFLLSFSLACDEGQPEEAAPPEAAGEEPVMGGEEGNERPHFPDIAEEAERTGAEAAEVPEDDDAVVPRDEFDGDDEAGEEVADDDDPEADDEDAEADDEEPEDED